MYKLQKIGVRYRLLTRLINNFRAAAEQAKGLLHIDSEVLASLVEWAFGPRADFFKASQRGS
jgi:hypothetical protein